MPVRAAVAVTGARGFRKGEEDVARSIIQEALEGLQIEPTLFITGASWGADTVAAQIGYSIWPPGRTQPGTEHRIVVPAAPHNEELVEQMRGLEGVVIERLARRHVKQNDAYMARNDRMIELAELLIAFPSTRTEQHRSGTWSTVRRARKKRLPIMFRPLDATPGWVQ